MSNEYNIHSADFKINKSKPDSVAIYKHEAELG